MTHLDIPFLFIDFFFVFSTLICDFQVCTRLMVFIFVVIYSLVLPTHLVLSTYLPLWMASTNETTTKQSTTTTTTTSAPSTNITTNITNTSPVIVTTTTANSQAQTTKATDFMKIDYDTNYAVWVLGMFAVVSMIRLVHYSFDNLQL